MFKLDFFGEACRCFEVGLKFGIEFLRDVLEFRESFFCRSPFGFEVERGAVG